ncbi:MAG: sulfatase-like hydrolase/transferase, partial [Acidobacteriota bacterium]
MRNKFRALLLLPFVAISCSRGIDEQAIESPNAPVVLISIDTLRSDRLPIYGYDRVETPAIDALAADSVVFDRAYSHYPLTLPSHVSVLTGLLPDRHGVRDNLGYPFDSNRFPYLPTILKQQGYATGAAVSAYVLRSETGIGTDFDFFDGDIFFREWVPGGALSRRGPETLEAALPWLRSVADQPFFLFFHIYEPHTPHEAPEPFASKFQLPYDAEVAAADAVVGDLLSELQDLGLYDSSLVILMSDHGEGLGDHGEAEHGVLLYREAIQVPLMVKLPGERRSGTRIDTPAQLADIAPTILDVLGLEANDDLAGVSRLELDADDQERPIYSESFYGRIHFGWSDLQSIVSGTHHYIHGSVPRMFDVVDDPAERHDILRDERPTFAKLRDEVMRYQLELTPPEEVDEETKLKLAALGYLDTNFGDTPKGPLPDPESRLTTLVDLWAAFDLRKEGKAEEALAAAERALAANPEMADAWQVKGSSLEDLGRFEEALEAYREALIRAGSRPRSDIVLAAARVQLELGQIDEALEGIDYAADVGVINPIALRQIGLQLAEVGRV